MIILVSDVTEYQINARILSIILHFQGLFTTIVLAFHQIINKYTRQLIIEPDSITLHPAHLWQDYAGLLKKGKSGGDLSDIFLLTADVWVISLYKIGFLALFTTKIDFIKEFRCFLILLVL